MACNKPTLAIIWTSTLFEYELILPLVEYYILTISAVINSQKITLMNTFILFKWISEIHSVLPLIPGTALDTL